MKRCFTLLSTAMIIVVSLFATSVSAQSSRSFITDAIEEHGECRNVAITMSNGNLALYQDNGCICDNIPADLHNVLRQLNANQLYIDDVHITESGNWLVLYGTNGMLYRGIDDDLVAAITDFNAAGEVIHTVTFNDNGDWIIISSDHIMASNNQLQEWIANGLDLYGQLWSACLTDYGLVAVHAEGFRFVGDVPQTLKDVLAITPINVYRLKFTRDAWFIADINGYCNYMM